LFSVLSFVVNGLRRCPRSEAEWDREIWQVDGCEPSLGIVKNDLNAQMIWAKDPITNHYRHFQYLFNKNRLPCYAVEGNSLLFRQPLPAFLAGDIPPFKGSAVGGENV